LFEHEVGDGAGRIDHGCSSVVADGSCGAACAPG